MMEVPIILDVGKSPSSTVEKFAAVICNLGCMRETIALFGTSADPPTVAHRAILVWLAQHFDHVFVWAADNPFKSDQTPLFHRQTMLRLLLDSIAPRLENVVWRPDLSHHRSLTSAQQVRAQWPEAALNLVVGSDILASLKDWYAIDQLMDLVQFVMVRRPGAPIDRGALETFRECGGRIEVADFLGPEMSSSDFRLYQRSEVVPQSVLDYLSENRLYQPVNVHV